MYYKLDGNSGMLTTHVDPVNRTYMSLVMGAPIDEQYENLPYVYTYDDSAGNPIPDYFSGSFIMSKKMLKVFTDNGAENIQTLPLKFINKKTDEARDDYVVFNIVGLVSCARLNESAATPLGGGYYFQNLVIDPAATRDLPVFRLKESSMDIIVNEKIANDLQENDVRGIILTPAAKP